MAPKEESHVALLNVVLARSSIERISVAPIGEATRTLAPVPNSKVTSTGGKQRPVSSFGRFAKLWMMAK